MTEPAGLQAAALTPLAARPVDRQLELVLAGSMQGYRWSLNGKAYPNNDSLLVRQGERVAIRFRNTNGMGHPMHLHGHVFQVVEINDQAVSGPLRDTVLVPAGGSCVVILDADQPGIWALHCRSLRRSRQLKQSPPPLAVAERCHHIWCARCRGGHPGR